MNIETMICEACGTLVAGNVLKSERVMKCPGLDCEEVLRFEDLPAATREYLVENREQYNVD